jgi:hypothetical protein
MNRQRILGRVRAEYNFTDWIDLIVDCLGRDTIRRNRLQAFRLLVEDKMLEDEDVRWIGEQSGLDNEDEI